jgi:hypothetical protein
MLHIQIIIGALVVISTMIGTAFVTSEIIATRKIAVVDLDECGPNMNAENSMVDYLHRIEVKVDDVREHIVILPKVIRPLVHSK